VTGKPASSRNARDRGVQLGEAIRRARQARGWTRDELAAHAGIAPRTLVRLEAEGTTGPSFFLVADLARALELSLADLDAHTRPGLTGLVSVGYEGRELDGFVEELMQAEVTMVADVRLTPLSRKPGFSKTRLGARLGEAGIEYRHLRSLGNPKENRPPFWEGRVEEGRARFRTLMEEPGAISALADLADHAGQQRVAVLCFERDEHRCHRKVVLDKVWDLAHIPVTRLG
jgi:transcriptional regulator with XRE-family HTH domain